ncbi:MAG: NAD-dependent deacylase [Chthonomonas sp.]|nr:NAD-dependent deacylase [Chthonomonas sp.]
MKVVVLTGAGISAESGLATFRSDTGLWAEYRIEDVCTPEALQRDPTTVLEFYNLRRREAASAEPNAAHHALAELERHTEVQIVTQNIDDLHERAGSRRVHHLHGEVFKVRSMENFNLVMEARDDIIVGDLAPDGSQLRPHVCFFGETPYGFELATDWAMQADVFVVIGTSLNVYPAAGLVDMTQAERIVLIDPDPPRIGWLEGRLEVINEPASLGVPKLVRGLLANEPA